MKTLTIVSVNASTARRETTYLYRYTSALDCRLTHSLMMRALLDLTVVDDGPFREILASFTQPMPFGEQRSVSLEIPVRDRLRAAMRHYTSVLEKRLTTDLTFRALLDLVDRDPERFREVLALYNPGVDDADRDARLAGMKPSVTSGTR